MSVYLNGVLKDESEIPLGAYKYVIVGHESRPELMIVRLFETHFDHVKCVDRSTELVTGAGFLAVVDGAEDVVEFMVNSATSGSLDIDGEIDRDTALIAKITGLYPAATMKSSNLKAITRKATASIDYDEAETLCQMHGLELEQCLEGEALLIPTTGAKLAFQTRRRGWMLYGYAANGSDIIKTLLSIVSRGRVKLEAAQKTKRG
jgi:hypothetical protein